MTALRDWRCILNHYYNANNNSKTVDPTNSGIAGTGLRKAFLQGAPTYGNVAFQDSSTSPTSIRVASAADGSGDRLLISSALHPSWAPGGSKLAFRTGTALGTINADGSGQTQITTNTGVDQYGNTKYDFNPAWSPLGDKIAFCSTRSGTGVDVWTVNPDGTDLVQVTYGLFDYDMGTMNEGYGCYLSWSPDGTKIAFTGDTIRSPYPLYRYNVYTMNASGGAVTQLTNCIESTGTWQSVCAAPSWSPNGAIIAFQDHDFQGDNIGGAGIYAMNSDGSGITPIYRSSATINEFPHWSTDGQRIIFLSNQSGNWGIWSMTGDGTDQVQIVGGSHYRYTPGQVDCSHCPLFDR